MLDIVAAQQHGVLTRTGLDAQRTARAAWAVDEVGDGTAVGGARAVAWALAAARSARWPLIPWRRPLRWVGAPWLLDRIYALVAANRHRLPGDEPWCVAHPGRCTPPSET